MCFLILFIYYDIFMFIEMYVYSFVWDYCLINCFIVRDGYFKKLNWYFNRYYYKEKKMVVLDKVICMCFCECENVVIYR